MSTTWTKRRRARSRAIAGLIAAVVLVLGALVAAGLLIEGTSGNTDSEVALEQVDSTSRSVGRAFPNFELRTPEGETVTRDSLIGKLSVVWFTTSICIPCQVGALEVARMNEADLNVLVVFVDPQEPASALTDWREDFGRPDWRVALDSRSTLSAAVGLQYLDTKFLLDERGTILNVDVAQVNEAYLRTLRDGLDA